MAIVVDPDRYIEHVFNKTRKADHLRRLTSVPPLAPEIAAGERTVVAEVEPVGGRGWRGHGAGSEGGEPCS